MPVNDDVPGRVTRAGLEFNYATWTAETVLTLCRVPWDPEYPHVVHFSSRQELDTYLDSKATTASRITHASYARVNMPIRIAMPFNAAITYNYIRAFNPSDGRAFYYFILDVRHIAPGTTELVVQLDVWQSYAGFTLGSVYVERGHIGIANKDGFEGNGRRYLTEPEGLETGHSLQIVARKTIDNLMSAGSDTSPKWYKVLFACTIELDGNYGTASAAEQTAATGTYLHGVPMGANMYIAGGLDFVNLMYALQDYPWIARGIIGAWIVPAESVDYYSDGVDTPYVGVRKIFQQQANSSHSYGDVLPAWRDDKNVMRAIPERYRHLKKLLTAPYCMIELTTQTGNNVTFRPEMLAGTGLKLESVVSLVPGAQRWVLYADGYNVSPNQYVDPQLMTREREPMFDGDGWDNALIFSNFPSLMVVNDNAALGLAMSGRSVQHARDSADWSRERAIMGAQSAHANATAGIDAMGSLASVEAQRQQLVHSAGMGHAQWQQVAGVSGGLAGAAASGSPIGGAVGAGGTALGALTAQSGMIAAESNHAANLGALSRNTSINQNTSGTVRDNNAALAIQSARGDYANTIAGINASIQDTRMAPPGVIGSLGGEMLGFIAGALMVNLRIRLIDEAAMRRIGEYWLRYGYAVNQYVNAPPIMVMSKFTYWKLLDCHIVHETVPQEHRLTIRGIFERGVTVWANPDDIGRIDFADNQPKDGITYG